VVAVEKGFMNDLSLRRIDISLLLLLFAGGILLRIILLAPTQFDGLYGQDAYAYYDFAGELRAAANQGRTPGHFFWPLGFPAVLAAAQTVFGTQPATAQAICVIIGALLVPLVYVLARQMGLGISGALIASLLMSVCGQAIQSSLVVMSDIPALCWALVSAILLWTYINGTHRFWLLPLAAIFLTLAGITRWLYLILTIPWIAAVFMVWRGRIRWRESVVAIIAAGSICLPQILYSRSNPQPVLKHAWAQGWSPSNILQQMFETIEGRFEYTTVNGLFYARPVYDAYYLAPVFTPFLLLGLWRLLREKKFAALLMLVGWVLLPYIFLAGIPYQNIRFPLIAFPAVAILAGCGLEYAAQFIGRFISLQYAYAALSALILFGVGHSLDVGTRTIRDFIAHQQEDKQVAVWAGERVPEGATVYTFGLTLTLQHYTSLNVHELFYETPTTLNQKWTPGQTDYLLLNVWNIEKQWVGLDPQLDYHWLRDIRGLIRLGKNGYYTLYRIKG
jgi:4-amino-4-deoxy-L-arabinose transferase-like glycosyltransferase